MSLSPVPLFGISQGIKDDLNRSSIPLQYALDVLKIYPFPTDPDNQYVIPYFHLDGSRIHNYYRIKLLPQAQSKYQVDPPKYLSPPGSSNHLYIPPDFIKNFKRKSKYFIITEGEKKAASLSRLGFPTLGIAGIDSWRTDRFEIKREQILNLQQLIKDPTAMPLIELDNSNQASVENRVVPELSNELFTFLNTIKSHPTIYLIFDRDPVTHPATIDNVSRALFDLSFWLQQQFEDVWSIALPVPPEYKTNPNSISHNKVGLDDFVTALLSRHSEATAAKYIEDYITTVNPTSDIRYKPHPHNLKHWLQVSLNKKTQTRDDKRKIARALINGLDNMGQRFHDETQTRFYFLTHDTKEVFEFTLSSLALRDFHQHPFGQFLSRTFGIGSNDSDALQRMANLYTGTGSRSIVPRRVSHATNHPITNQGVLYVQLTDSQLLKITGSSFDVVENGIDGQLFVSNLSKPANVEALNEYLLDEDTDSLPNWFDALASTTLQPIHPFTRDETVAFIGCLFYLSPWFRRFRGLQLPIEMAIAEPGSGKSFLYKLRQGILTGNSQEQSIPQQLRDWYTSVTNGSDLWVGDNVNALGKDIKAVLPDELCRITTSESPSITIRQLYTTNTVAHLEIPCTFAFTAIQNPFVAEDFVQRSVIMKFSALTSYDADWVTRQLQPANQGRERWLSHQAKVAQRFLNKCDLEFNPDYQSSHRLMHFEQCIKLMAESLKEIDSLAPNLKHHLTTMQAHIADRTLEKISISNVEESSPALQALKKFSDQFRSRDKVIEFTMRQLTDWISSNLHYEYGHINMLTNPYSLGKYITAHSSDVVKVSGIYKLNKQLKGTPGYGIKPGDND